MQQILIAERLTGLAPEALILMLLAFVMAVAGMVFIVVSFKDFE